MSRCSRVEFMAREMVSAVACCDGKQTIVAHGWLRGCHQSLKHLVMVDVRAIGL